MSPEDWPYKKPFYNNYEHDLIQAKKMEYMWIIQTVDTVKNPLEN